MNVFVLSTGRCGSTTFVEACNHISNYSAKHESRSHLVGDPHFQYPANHIESDNRLSWLLGRLEDVYGDDAIYVHLKRDDLATAKSFAKRYDDGIIYAYRSSILMRCPDYADPLEVCLDYCHTVNSNIECFLQNKSRKMTMNLASAQEDFRSFWDLIQAEGELEAALSHWSVAYNATDRATHQSLSSKERLIPRIGNKLGRIVSKLPYFLKNA